MLRPGSKHEIGSVCKVGTQDPENLDEEVKPLVTVWWQEPLLLVFCKPLFRSLSAGAILFILF